MPLKQQRKIQSHLAYLLAFYSTALADKKSDFDKDEKKS